VARHIGAVLDGLVHLEAIVLHRIKHLRDEPRFQDLLRRVGLSGDLSEANHRSLPPRSTLLFVPPLPKRFATTVSIKRN
jgi:hypothetical protein